MRLLRKVPRPSPAIVIASLALAVALGGTGYATVLAVAPNSVGTAQLKARSVTNKKVADNAITSRKVLNRTLQRVDFASGQLPAGPPGPAGPAGPQGAPGLSGVERLDVTSVTNSGASKSMAIPCPSGKRLLGGGARLNPQLAQLALQSSYPDNDNVYRVTAREITATAANWSVTVFAVCALAS